MTKNILKIFSIMLLGFVFINANAQENLKTHLYLKAPQFLFPEDDFGYTTNYAEGVILNGFGIGAGFGTMVYPEMLKLNSMVNLGLDLTFLELNIIDAEVLEDFDDSFYWDDYNTVGIVSFGSKVGPILTLNPVSKLTFDIYGQFKYALTSIEAYDDFSEEMISKSKMVYSYVGGINMGWYIMNVSFEYVFSQPEITVPHYTNGNYTTRDMKLVNNYFKIALLFKFAPFKKSTKYLYN